MPRNSPRDPPGEAAAASPAGLSGPLHRALTDLHAYAMYLESQSEPRDEQLQDELEALRSVIATLREQGSAPDG